MSKDRKKVLHIHSNVNDKQPTPTTLEYGELGVNYASGNTFISTKNSNDEVVRFSEDETIINWMEMKEVFPYEGYVRDRLGTPISYSSGTISTQDLLDNKSNIIIKINQVAAENSIYDEKINGAKDIYGNAINPISSDGYRDGAGFAIDMSPYAMIGANPSFSSVTVDCRTELNGTTIINGEQGDCGSKFEVNVKDICIQSSDKLNEYGVNESNFGTSCDGTKVSRSTTIKGDNISIDSTRPGGDKSISLNACDNISSSTNSFKVVECNDGNGNVGFDTTTMSINACDNISSHTDSFNIVECSEGSGEVVIDTTTVSIDACDNVSSHTNSFNIVECNDGDGEVVIDTTNINISADSTVIKSCEKFTLKSDDINIEQCGENGSIDIKSCDRITLSSDNIVMSGCSDDGKVTITTNDLCLVGDAKINVYGEETNVGLDCTNEEIAENTRVFGKGTLITTKLTPNTYASENNVETVAAQDINENADRDINETAIGNINESTTNGNINESAKNINNTASNNICETAANEATFYGAVETNVGINCDDTATAATTTVKGGTVIVEASTTDVDVTANQDINEEADNNVNVIAGNNICVSAGTDATLFGVETTRVGFSCDGNDKTERLEIGGNVICLDAEDKASIYGVNTSSLGINCAEDDRSTVTNVSGDTINEGGNVINIDAEDSINESARNEINISADALINESATTINETASSSINESAPYIYETARVDIVERADGDIYITAGDQLCEKATEASFYGTQVTSIGKGCDGTLSRNITYWRNEEPVCDNGVPGFSSTTVDDALDEVYYRSQVSMTSTGNTTGIDVPVPESGTSIVRSGSTTYTIHQDSDGCDKTYDFIVDNTIVSMSAYTYGAEDENAKKYTFWQYIGDNRVEIGEINIPKDHILKDASIVNGHAEGDSFTACTSGDNSCHWYIKLVWNVFDPESGHTNDKTVYLPADDFVQDLVVNNPANNGVQLEIWYDGAKKNISAHTEMHMIHGNNSADTKYDINGASHALTSYTLNSTSGDVKAVASLTNWVYDPFDENGKLDIKVPTDVTHLNRNILKVAYGKVCSAQSQTYDPGAGTENMFDANNRYSEITIPKSLSDLGYTKLDIQYGKVCDKSNQTYDPGASSGGCTVESQTVYIPNKLEHLGYSKLKVEYGKVCGASGETYDPGKMAETDSCSGVTQTITIPSKLAHLGYNKLEIQYGDVCGRVSGETYDPGKLEGDDGCDGTTQHITIPSKLSDLGYSKLKIKYGNACSESEKVYDPGHLDTNACSGLTEITIPGTLGQLTNSALTLNDDCGSDSRCVSVNGDICVSGVVKASAFYSTSDRELKENINQIMFTDYDKADAVSLVSFNFKDDDTKKKTYGVIAQEVESAGLYELIHKDENGFLSVDYTSLLILKIAKLEAKIRNLEKSFIELQNKKED